MELEKTGEASGAAEARDTITFRFTGTNTGNVTLSDVSISDELDGLGELSYNWPGVPGTLAPGERVTATPLCTVTDEDAETGAVHNTATISGADPRAHPWTTMTRPQSPWARWQAPVSRHLWAPWS